MRLIIAFVAAALAPTCALGLWYLYGQFATFDSSDPYIWIRTRGFLLICLVISAAHVVALGIPAYLLLRWRRALRWWSALLSGFVLGAVPVGIFSWPLRYSGPGSSSSVNGVDTMVDGIPTMAGWVQYLGGISFFGACGALAAAAFWVVRCMISNDSFKPNPLRGSAYFRR
ncbi:hypothetical protein [Pseudoxanthomonas sp. UC19_8]|uniref:hypothetical protein n=1 Tax=Pseudoxanthomonas sp. UC19_8 TaxID=3350175 RepID=UPI0036D39F7A